MKRRGIINCLVGMAMMFVLLFAVGGITALADDATVVSSGSCGADGDNVTWTLDSNGLLTISGEGAMADYGSYYDRSPWYECDIEEVNIENGVTSIGSCAFYDCGLMSVTIGNDVTSIGSKAFSECDALVEFNYNAKAAADLTSYSDVFRLTSSSIKVVIGDDVEKIPAYLFYQGPVKSITIGSNVTYIGNYAFAYCNYLTEINYNAEAATDVSENSFSGAGSKSDSVQLVIGNEVKMIPDDAFSSDSLTSLTIGNSVTSIGASAFFGCDRLDSVIIPDSVTSIGGSAFRGCTGLMNIEIGSGVTSIGGSAFYGCTGLTSIAIPENVTSIGASAFLGCTGLTSVTIPDNITSIGRNAFSDCTGLKKIYYNAKSAEIPDNDSYHYGVFEDSGTSSDGIQAVIGDGVEKIPDYLFNDCANLTSAAIGSSVTSIGDYAFSGCVGLTSITIPEGVTSIGVSTFSGCTGLTGITIPENVTSIEDFAFYGCTGLTSITIPENVTNIGYRILDGCTGLTEIRYNAKNATCTMYEFVNVGTSSVGLSAIIGDNVEKIPDYLFDDCANLTSVTIGSGVNSIGSSAFYDCTGLTSITIPENVTSIGGSAFGGCTGLTKIYYNAISAKDLSSSSDVFKNVGKSTDGLQVIIGDEVEKIPSYLFEGCTNLTSITFGSGKFSIGEEAFYGCTGLTSITIPENVASIGNNIFFGCTGLTKIYYNAKAVTSESSYICPFYNAGSSTESLEVYFGEKVKKLPANLFANCNIRKFEFAGDPPSFGSNSLGYTYESSGAYALYPIHNSEWTESIRNECGPHLTWIGYCDEPVSSAACITNKTLYITDETLSDDITMTVMHTDGCTEEIPYALLNVGSYDFSTSGEKTIDVTYNDIEAELCVYVHDRKTETIDKSEYPESSHDYENNLDETYTYTAEGALYLDVTFSAQTEVENNVDYLYVNGTQYTGTELAGKTITIEGDTLTIRLVSDKNDGAYGFSIDSIVKSYIGHDYDTTTVAPTCTSRGYTVKKCACGDTVTTYQDALGHDMVTDAAVAATCTETGLTEGSHCSRCDEVTTEQEVLPALGHSEMTHYEANDPSCTTAGNREYWYCSRCEKTFSDENGTTELTETEIEAKGHDYIYHEKVDASHEASGMEAHYTCEHCSAYFDADKNATTKDALTIEQIAHSFGAWTQTETTHTRSCSCGKTEEAAHSFEWVLDKAATEEATGLKHEECSVCHYAKPQVEIEKLDHVHSMIHNNGVEATCTTDGNVEYWHCEKCGYDYADEDGNLVLTTVKIDALGHTMTYNKPVEVTCTSDGANEYWHCGRCKVDFADEDGVNVITNIVIKSPGHQYGEYVETTPATYTEKGVETATCSVCLDKVTRDIEPLGYKPGEVETPVTGLIKCGGTWYYFKNGKVTGLNALAKNAYGWWYVGSDGCIDFNYTGVGTNAYGTWYVNKGKVQTSVTGLIKCGGTWYYFKNGKVTGLNALAKNAYGWWYVGSDGCIDFNYTGVGTNAYGTWYVNKGKVQTSVTGLIKCGGTWYYFKNGKVTGLNALAKNAYGWWYIGSNGQINTRFTGIASNAYGQWYVRNGKVITTYSGTVTYMGHRYSIRNGKATMIS